MLTWELVCFPVLFWSGFERCLLISVFAENDWGKATVNITQVGNFEKAPYKFKLTPLLLVEPIVKLGAGVGKI